MNIEQIINQVSSSFQKNHPETAASQTIYLQYAKEELRLTDEQASIYLEEQMYGDTLASPVEMARFFVWYYFNHVHPRERQAVYTVDIVCDDIPPFTESFLEPVRLERKGNLMVASPCKPEEAAFWCVFVQGPQTEKTCIADCINQDAAEAFLQLIQQVYYRYLPS